MQYAIREYRGYDEAEVLSLYHSVGWRNYTEHPRMLEHAFAHSLQILGAFDGDALIGLIRVVGDGHSVVLIQDLLVQPDWQRQGVGTALVQAVLQAYPHVYQTHLMTDDSEKTIRFYQSLGFTMDADMGCRAFSIYRKPNE